jgi:hypothetical protein
MKIELEDQVVSLDVARELAEKMNGVGIDTAHYWGLSGEKISLYNDKHTVKMWCESMTPAPTLTEMLALLPNVIHHIDDTDNLSSFLLLDKGLIGYWCADNCIIKYHYNKDNPATAAAKLYIRLIDNGYIKGDTNDNS